MSEEAVKNYFKAIAKHITNKSYILGTLDCFESDEELDIMTKLFKQKPKNEYGGNRINNFGKNS